MVDDILCWTITSFDFGQHSELRNWITSTVVEFDSRVCFFYLCALSLGLCNTKDDKSGLTDGKESLLSVRFFNT